jgi:hypothetical protein
MKKAHLLKGFVLSWKKEEEGRKNQGYFSPSQF